MEEEKRTHPGDMLSQTALVLTFARCVGGLWQDKISSQGVRRAGFQFWLGLCVAVTLNSLFCSLTLGIHGSAFGLHGFYSLWTSHIRNRTLCGLLCCLLLHD